MKTPLRPTSEKPLTSEEILNRFQKLTVWKSQGRRAPHKPLLALIALGHILNDSANVIPWATIKVELKRLLEDFGPPGNPHPEYPFWRLQKDGLWIVEPSNLPVNGSGDVSSATLDRINPSGCFPPDVRNLLSTSKALCAEAARILLEAHFPSSLHNPILDAVGLSIIAEQGPHKGSRIRDPRFREKVLVAYKRKCAICKFDVRLSNQCVGLEAAHIKWFQAGGPDIVQNGVALCCMHHHLFDRGAFTFQSAGDFLRLQPAEDLCGNSGLDEWILRFKGEDIYRPLNHEYSIDQDYIQWHCEEVFRG